MDYKKKYLKYKLKYLTAKKTYYGGTNKIFYKTHNTAKENENNILNKNNPEDSYLSIKTTIEPGTGIEVLKERLKKQEEERLKKQEEEERLAELKRKEEQARKEEEIDECHDFTICQTWTKNCGLIAASNLFIKIPKLNNRLKDDFKKYFNNFKVCPIAEQSTCSLHPRLEDVKRIYLLYWSLLRQIFVKGEHVVIYPKPIDDVTMDSTDEIAYFITICELNNIQFNFYEFININISNSLFNIKHRPGVGDSITPSLNCLFLNKITYPNFTLLHRILKKNFLRLDFINKSTVSTDLSSILLGGSIFFGGSSIGHVISFTICEGEMVVSNWGKTFNCGNQEELKELEIQLDQLYKKRQKIKEVFLIYEVSINERIKNIARRPPFGFPVPQLLKKILDSIPPPQLLDVLDSIPPPQILDVLKETYSGELSLEEKELSQEEILEKLEKMELEK